MFTLTLLSWLLQYTHTHTYCSLFFLFSYISVIVMAPKMQCECKSFSCGASGGKMQSSRAAHRHIKEDNMLCKITVPIYKSISEFEKYMDLGLYKTHWSAKHRLNKKLSILEFILEIMCEFVSIPNG